MPTCVHQKIQNLLHICIVTTLLIIVLFFVQNLFLHEKINFSSALDIPLIPRLEYFSTEDLADPTGTWTDISSTVFSISTDQPHWFKIVLPPNSFDISVVYIENLYADHIEVFQGNDKIYAYNAPSYGLILKMLTDHPMQPLYIKLTPYTGRLEIGSLRLGSYENILIHYIRTHLPNIAVGSVILFCGIVFFIVGFLIKHSNQKLVFLFSASCTFTSLWIIVDFFYINIPFFSNLRTLWTIIMASSGLSGIFTFYFLIELLALRKNSKTFFHYLMQVIILLYAVFTAIALASFDTVKAFIDIPSILEILGILILAVYVIFHVKKFKKTIIILHFVELKLILAGIGAFVLSNLISIYTDQWGYVK